MKRRANSSLWIGLYPGMGEERLDYMIETIRAFAGKDHARR